MKRVMNNPVPGAKPLRPDGAFYYRDHNFKGHKINPDRRWPWCSGTLAKCAAGRRDPQKWQATSGTATIDVLPL